MVDERGRFRLGQLMLGCELADGRQHEQAVAIAPEQGHLRERAGGLVATFRHDGGQVGAG